MHFQNTQSKAWIESSVLIAVLIGLWDIVALRLVLHRLTHMDLLLVRSHSMMMVNHTTMLNMRCITPAWHQRW
jgi:hypothetical protein